MWPRDGIERLFTTTYRVPIDPVVLNSLPRVSQDIV